MARKSVVYDAVVDATESVLRDMSDEVVRLHQEQEQNFTYESSLEQRIEKQKKALAFFRSVILSGEAWSETCQDVFDRLLPEAPDDEDDEDREVGDHVCGLQEFGRKGEVCPACVAVRPVGMEDKPVKSAAIQEAHKAALIRMFQPTPALTEKQIKTLHDKCHPQGQEWERQLALKVVAQLTTQTEEIAKLRAEVKRLSSCPGCGEINFLACHMCDELVLDTKASERAEELIDTCDHEYGDVQVMIERPAYKVYACTKCGAEPSDEDNSAPEVVSPLKEARRQAEESLPLLIERSKGTGEE